MPIQVWLARMERSLTEQEYGDMMALLPDARPVRFFGDVGEEKRLALLPLFSRRRLASWLPVLYG